MLLFGTIFDLFVGCKSVRNLICWSSLLLVFRFFESLLFPPPPELLFYSCYFEPIVDCVNHVNFFSCPVHADYFIGGK
uniref:Putative ovule protein n=1 Tax=Solanum chacoense TaxID=4108 RepID=A0A0V0HT43_SOLCH